MINLDEILNQSDKIELLNKNDIKLMLEEYKSTGSAIIVPT
jgi:hypothetical protein